MLTIIYAPVFVRKFKKLEEPLQQEILEKIKLFHDRKNHRQLKVHKLHGRLAGCLSFSVNYRVRIVFEYVNKNSAALLDIGTHKVYNI